MTEVPEYTTPDEAFKKLYELEDNCPEYCIVQGELYEDLRSDARIDEKQAAQMSRLLNRGKVEDAEDLVSEVLDG